MSSTSHSLHRNTPTIAVVDNRGLAVRALRYHRHPNSSTLTDERITYYQFNPRGQLQHSIDPRLFALQQTDSMITPNITAITSFTGEILGVDSVDGGRTIALNDIAGRPQLRISATDVTRRWQYENNTLPGRAVSISDRSPGGKTQLSERFFWGGANAVDKAMNLAGQCVRHYDTAGLFITESISLTAVPSAVSRQLLKEDQTADWQGSDESSWRDLLAAAIYNTRSVSDATGELLKQTDAKGNLQRFACNVAGQLAGCWLTLKGGAEQAIVASLVYSAAGQKLHEVQGNGVVIHYRYEPQTQRLTGMKTERPAGHSAGEKVLQDLRYHYDPLGNLLLVRNEAETTRYWRNQKVEPVNSYVYDTLYQLTEASGREMASIGQQNVQLPAPLIPLPSGDDVFTNYTRTYHYDRGDNLNKISHSAPATGNNYSIDITVSSRSNRAVVSALTDDPTKVDNIFDDGGHQSRMQPGQLLSWTIHGELLQVMPVTREGAASDKEHYRYDSGGLRINKVSQQQTGNSSLTQRVTYLPGLELRTSHIGVTLKEDLHTLTPVKAGHGRMRLLHWETGLPAGMTNNQLRYNYEALSGNWGLELDGTGQLISQEEHYPYGGTALWAARSQIDASYKVIRYRAKERDVSGLYYYGYRYYQPWAGRWLSPDPAGTEDGLNLYRMAKNNPTSNEDQHGFNSTPVSIPKKAHFVWEGGELSQLDLFNVLNFQRLNQDYEVYFWTSRPWTFYRALERARSSHTSAYRYVSFNMSNPDRILVRDPGELFKQVDAKLSAFHAREKEGPYSNKAAASDITRLVALHVMGGLYMDTDISRESQVANFPQGDDFFMYYNEEVGYGNGVLASAPNTTATAQILASLIETYLTRPYMWRVKRANIARREQLTLRSSGPELIYYATGAFLKAIPDTEFGQRMRGLDYYQSLMRLWRQVPEMYRNLSSQKILSLGHINAANGDSMWADTSAITRERRASIS